MRESWDRQHRNRALAVARHARAVQLAAEGVTYQAIAAHLTSDVRPVRL
jgi:hypothetical protein